MYVGWCVSSRPPQKKKNLRGNVYSLTASSSHLLGFVTAALSVVSACSATTAGSFDSTG